MELLPTKKPQQILFSKNHYSPWVKVENWWFEGLCEKKDNYVYRDQLRNSVSTYNRLGTEDIGARTTETRDMQAQIFGKVDPIYNFKPLVNFTSYPCTDTPGRNRLMRKANLVQLPTDYGVMDYITTHQDDYRMPFPNVTKPLTMASPEWLMNRLIRSDLTQTDSATPPPGDYQYLDIHTPIDHIRKLRLFRCQSFDPATGARTFPSKKQ